MQVEINDVLEAYKKEVADLVQQKVLMSVQIKNANEEILRLQSLVPLPNDDNETK